MLVSLSAAARRVSAVDWREGGRSFDADSFIEIYILSGEDVLHGM